MKLQIPFDMRDLDKALQIAHLVENYVDIFEIGTLLIYQHGVKAVTEFRQKFPKKTLLADCKIVDRGKDAVTEFANAGANWVTVMAGTAKEVIHISCATANNLNVKVMLDLIDSSSLGQSALEAKTLGVDALLFHQPYDAQESFTFLDKWDMVKGNTNLPIFVSGKIGKDTIVEVLNVKPDGIIIGKSIVDAENPEMEVKYYFDLCSKN